MLRLWQCCAGCSCQQLPLMRAHVILWMIHPANHASCLECPLPVDIKVIDLSYAGLRAPVREHHVHKTSLFTPACSSMPLAPPGDYVSEAVKGSLVRELTSPEVNICTAYSVNQRTALQLNNMHARFLQHVESADYQYLG